MKKLFKKTGLIKNFEIQFPIENQKAIELLKSDKCDVKINLLDTIFGKEIPFNSTDFKFNNILTEFSTNRESIINPMKGRAKIKFKVEPFEKNSTLINVNIESYSSDLKFVLITTGILVTIITFAVISNESYGIEWIFSITGFFFFLITFVILFQKFEINKAQKALMKYFERLKQ